MGWKEILMWLFRKKKVKEAVKPWPWTAEEMEKALPPLPRERWDKESWNVNKEVERKCSCGTIYRRVRDDLGFGLMCTHCKKIIGGW